MEELSQVCRIHAGLTKPLSCPVCSRQYALQSDNTQRYQELASRLSSNAVNRCVPTTPPPVALHWHHLHAESPPVCAVTCRAQIDQKERKAAQRHDRLEAELNNYKTNLIKESIRMGHNDMGDFYYGKGDLQVPIE